MITRMYPNAARKLQTVALSSAEWEALSQEDLDGILGFRKPAPEPAPAPAPAPAPKTTKRTRK